MKIYLRIDHETDYTNVHITKSEHHFWLISHVLFSICRICHVRLMKYN